MPMALRFLRRPLTLHRVMHLSRNRELGKYELTLWQSKRMYPLSITQLCNGQLASQDGLWI